MPPPSIKLNDLGLYAAIGAAILYHFELETSQVST